MLILEDGEENENMRKKCGILILVIALLLTACGQGGKVENVDPKPGAASRSEFDWRTGEWKTDLSAGEAHTLYLGKYEEGLEADQAGDRSTRYRVWGSSFYSLDRFAQNFPDSGRVEWRYSLDSYECGSGEIKHVPVTLPSLPDYAEMDLFVSSFDIMNDQEAVLFVRGMQSGAGRAYLAMHISMDGKQTADIDTVDLQPVIQEHGGRLAEGYALEEVYVDRQGYYYVIPDIQQGRVLVLKPDGSLAEVIKGDREDMWVRFACKDPDGGPVFKWYRPGEDMLQLAGYAPNTGRKVYAEVKLPSDSAMAMTEDGYLYYGGMDGDLYRWDLYTGSREFCISYGAQKIGSNPNVLQIAIDAEGNPVLLDYVSGSAGIYCMGPDVEHEKTVIRLVNMAYDISPESNYLATWAADFSREQEEYEIVVEKPDFPAALGREYFEAQLAFRERKLIELTAGKGADLYLVSPADMKLLYEKGALADLTGVLSPELKECIFPGILAGGMFDNKQIGLALTAYALITMVSNDLWPEDSWTLEEALELVESDPRLEYVTIDLRGKYSAQQTMIETFLQDMNCSPFLDLEKGTCDFTNPLFSRILELTRNYGPTGSWESDPLKDGTSAAFTNSVGGYVFFASMMNQYGDKYHAVGLPTNGESGNYWNVEYYLVMNNNTQYRDILEECLSELYDVDRQKGLISSVRNDMVSHCLVYNDFDPYLNSEWLWDMGNGSYTFATMMKPDGSTWEQEFVEFMNSCVPKPGDTDSILNILMEEIDSFYNGDKDAAAVAEIIQNKVQLYLDEHN